MRNACGRKWHTFKNRRNLVQSHWSRTVISEKKLRSTRSSNFDPSTTDNFLWLLNGRSWHNVPSTNLLTSKKHCEWLRIFCVPGEFSALKSWTIQVTFFSNYIGSVSLNCKEITRKWLNRRKIMCVLFKSNEYDIKLFQIVIYEYPLWTKVNFFILLYHLHMLTTMQIYVIKMKYYAISLSISSINYSVYVHVNYVPYTKENYYFFSAFFNLNKFC